MLCSGFSTRLMMSRSTDSGEAPGYGKLMTMTGWSTSGIWLTRRFFSASRPSAMSTMMMATVWTGCLMLKFERNMGLPEEALLLCDHRGLGLSARADFLAILQRVVRKSQHLVTLGEARAQRVGAAAQVTVAQIQRDFLQF